MIVKTLDPDTGFASRSISIRITPATSRRSRRACRPLASRGRALQDLEVWDFPDCEVVYYQASTDGHSVRCVEFEATRKESLAGALAIVERYERATGFDRADRTRRPLIEIMFPDVMDLLAVPPD